MVFIESGSKADVTLLFESAVAQVELCGSSLRESVTSVLADVYFLRDQPEIYAAVACYDIGDIHHTAWDVSAAVRDAGIPDAIPLAIVAPLDAFVIARDYCRRQCAEGLLRAAFTTQPTAMEWAKEHAALIRLHRRRAGELGLSFPPG